MYIYNPYHNLILSQHILDPDEAYHTSLHQENLHLFFKKMTKPENIQQITGIYIEYSVAPYLFENNPEFYQKISPKILDAIVRFLDVGYANLLYDGSQRFFLVMFDINEEDVTKVIVHLYHYLNEHPFCYHQHHCTIQIKCGIYFSHIGINPYHLYKSSKEQFGFTLRKDKSILSMNHLSSR